MKEVKRINNFQLGLDFDSVLVGTEIAYCDLFNKYTGEHITPSDLTEYDTTKVLPQKYNYIANKLWEMPALYDYVQPKENSQRYTKLLSEQENIDLYVVTVSSPKVIERKFQYLHREFPWIKQDNIIVTANKPLLNLNLLLDDNPKNLLLGKYHKLLFNMYWNKTFDAERNGMLRCMDWDDTYNKIQDRISAWKSVQELMN